MNILTPEEIETIRLLHPDYHTQYMYTIQQLESFADGARLRIQETLNAAKNLLIQSGQVVPTE